jgi:hypothetical protein
MPKLELISVGSVLQITNNRLTSLAIGGNPAEVLNSVYEKEGGTVSGIFTTGFITNNTFSEEKQVFLAENLALASNAFSIHDQFEGLAVARKVTIVGNIGGGTLYTNVLGVQFQQAANLMDIMQG